MWRWTAVALVVLICGAVLAPSPCFAQQDQPESRRKLVNKVVPIYPSLARPLSLKGTVRVEALVATNGAVKSVEVKGGHPILAQAAQDAIRHWKWEPSTHETREPIEVKFDPQ